MQKYPTGTRREIRSREIPYTVRWAKQNLGAKSGQVMEEQMYLYKTWVEFYLQYRANYASILEVIIAEEGVVDDDAPNTRLNKNLRLYQKQGRDAKIRTLKSERRVGGSDDDSQCLQPISYKKFRSILKWNRTTKTGLRVTRVARTRCQDCRNHLKNTKRLEVLMQKNAKLSTQIQEMEAALEKSRLHDTWLKKSAPVCQGHLYLYLSLSLSLSPSTVSSLFVSISFFLSCARGRGLPKIENIDLILAAHLGRS
jgi:hypothetical protein